MRGGHLPPTPGLSAEESRREVDERKAADRQAKKVYWLSLLVVCLITTFATLTEYLGKKEGEGLLVAGAIIVGFLPAAQLAASVLALIYINVYPPARKPDCLRRLGRITLLSFIWGLIGAALTWVVLAGFRW